MITAKTKALLVAMTLLGAAPAAIPALADNTVIQSNSDDDEVKQENKVKVEQECKQENESGGDAFQVIGVDAQANTCTQGAIVTTTNANIDNDVQANAAVVNDQDLCDLVDVLTVNADFVDC